MILKENKCLLEKTEKQGSEKVRNEIKKFCFSFSKCYK